MAVKTNGKTSGEKRGKPIGFRSPRRGPNQADELAARVVANVRRIRTEKGISQQQLAAKMGCNTSTIGGIEASICPGLQTRTIVALAAALDVLVDDLLADPRKEGP